MKKLFSIWIMFAGLLVVSCGTSYHTASSAYDDATYLRPGVTARVHLFATAQEAEELKNKTLEQAGREGTRVETVYTDPEGTVDIDVKSGTTYLIMNTQDDSYERKLEMFNDNPEDNFSLTINMNFAMDDWYYGSWYGYGPYNYWGYYSHWYSPYWHNPWWYSPHWHNPWWYSPYRFSSYWYLPYWYYDWYYPGWGYGYSYYNPHNPHHNPYPANRHNKPAYGTDNRNARRVMPNDKITPSGTSSGTASATSRSGGSYRRVNPQINQVSGAREESVFETGKATEYSRVNRTTNQATGSGAVYREGTDGTVSRTEQSAGENTFYRRSSNASKNTTTTTTNPGNSRSFYREGQRSSTTVNQRNNSESGVRSNSGTSRSSTSTTRSNTSTTESRSSSYRSNTSSGNAAVSGTRSSVSSGSRSSYSGSTSGSTGTTSSGSGSSYHRR